MNDGNSILYTKDYGRIRVKLQELMDAQGITRNALARKAGSRFEVIDKWYSGEVERVDLDILARVCYILNCSVEDILTYEKD